MVVGTYLSEEDYAAGKFQPPLAKLQPPGGSYRWWLQPPNGSLQPRSGGYASAPAAAVRSGSRLTLSHRSAVMCEAAAALHRPLLKNGRPFSFSLLLSFYTLISADLPLLSLFNRHCNRVFTAVS